MIENDKKAWGILDLHGELRSVLEIAVKSTNEKAKKAAIEFIHRLAARGHLEFRDLLPQQTS